MMLHSHPRIAIPPENRFLLGTYRGRLTFGDLEVPANRRALAEFIVNTRGHRFRDFGLDSEETIEQIVNGPPTVGSALGIVFRAYAERFARPRWGDKRPGYHNHIGTIMRLFPDAQIVHMVRDPRDCVASLKQMPWWKLGSYDSIVSWLQSITYTEEAVRRWPGAVTSVKYERLVSDPDTELRALCAALGETYDPAMAEPEQIASIAVQDRKHWHSNTRVSPTTRAIGRWRKELEPWEAALCEMVLGGRMAKFGYERSGAGRPPVGHLARFARVHVRRTSVRGRRLVKDRWKRRREENPVAALLTSGQRAATRAPNTRTAAHPSRKTTA